MTLASMTRSMALPPPTYDQRDGKRIFLGVGSTFIEGRIFKTTILAVDPRPADPMAEFTVMPDE